MGVVKFFLPNPGAQDAIDLTAFNYTILDQIELTGNDSSTTIVFPDGVTAIILWNYAPADVGDEFFLTTKPPSYPQPSLPAGYVGSPSSYSGSCVSEGTMLPFPFFVSL